MPGKKLSVFYMKNILELEKQHLNFLNKSKDRILKNLEMVDNQIDIFENEIEYIINYLDKFDEQEDEDE